MTVGNKGRHGSLSRIFEEGHEQFVFGRDTGRRVEGTHDVRDSFRAAQMNLERRLGT